VRGMEESLKVKNVLKRKINSIPRAVNYWIFFKRNMLEKQEIRSLFEKELEEDEFRTLVKTKINPKIYGPSFCRNKSSKSSKTSKRNIDDLLVVLWEYYRILLHPSSPVYVAPSNLNGLGIFLRNEMVFKKHEIILKDFLYGVLFEVDEDDFEELHKKEYPSLYEDGQKTFILCGPGSLVNHQCGSFLSLTKPRKMVKEEFNGISSIYIVANVDEKCKVLKNQEIYIDYLPQSEDFNETYFPKNKCLCITCLK